MAINKIYLIKKWNKSFYLFYIKIEKIRAKISSYISFLSISATLIKKNAFEYIIKLNFIKIII